MLFVCPPKFYLSIIFYFLLGPLLVQGENKINVCAKFWRTKKEYHCIFGSGLSTLNYILYQKLGLYVDT